MSTQTEPISQTAAFSETVPGNSNGMRITATIVRILMGLLFVFGAAAFFFKFMPEPELKGSAKTFMEGVSASVYLMPFIKATELVCGFLFLSGFFVPLATVMIFPIILNILSYGIFVDHQAIPIGIFLLLANLFLAYYHRKKYAPMLVAK
jgi:uncharacterized membrane protein YphA (DoxX/SURF4 family)